MKYKFDSALYFKHMWYIYLAVCIGVTGVLYMFMYMNENLDVIPALVCFASVLFITVLVLLNRLRTWNGSYVEVKENFIEYMRIKASGYSGSDMTGNWVTHTSSYWIFTVRTIEYCARGIKVYGYINEEIVTKEDMTKKKMNTKDVVWIPKYFEKEQDMYRNILEFYKRRKWQDGRRNQG